MERNISVVIWSQELVMQGTNLLKNNLLQDLQNLGKWSDNLWKEQICNIYQEWEWEPYYTKTQSDR